MKGLNSYLNWLVVLIRVFFGNKKVTSSLYRFWNFFNYFLYLLTLTQMRKKILDEISN